MSSSLKSNLSNLGDAFNVPDERILKAVEKAGNRAVPSDVAALAGVDLNTAKAGLVNLANMVGGDLEVSEDGALVYNFPPNFRGVLLQKSAYQRAVQAGRAAWPPVFWAIRVGFGISLLGSIALVFSTLIVAMAALEEGDSGVNFPSTGSSSGDRRRNRDWPQGGGRMVGFSWFDVVNVLSYRPTYGYYGYSDKEKNWEKKRGDDMGFFESVFSYIFGDGDPNAGMDQRRVEALAKLIRANGGAVTAEQLAPLLTPREPKEEDSRMIVDESFVLPILTALDGLPEVTEDGDIVYAFPSLQTSAIGDEENIRRRGLESLSTSDLRTSLDAVGVRSSTMFERSELVQAAFKAGIQRLPDGAVAVIQSPMVDYGRGGGVAMVEPLEESIRKFTLASDSSVLWARVLGAVNLIGVIALQVLLMSARDGSMALPGIFGTVQSVMPFLLAYAVAFNVIPIVRGLTNKRENEQIRQRNGFRRQWAERLKNGGAVVKRKLKAAKNMATSLNVIETKDVKYTTAKSMVEQGLELEDFDLRLNEKKSNNSDAKQLDT